MKKTYIKMIAVVLMTMFLCPVAMAMDIARGDRGEMVASIQEMLLQMGWLQDDPDGIFGKNTQQAVMDFEDAHYFPVDGIVDDALYEAICVAWNVAQEEGMDEDWTEESNGAYDEVVRLNSDIIICGTDIYYSGAVNGDDPGVYVIDADSRNERLISDMRVNLGALCYENLLVNQYLEDGDQYVLTVLDRDGTIIPVTGDYARRAIVSYGRFYWGSGSCRWDGSDLHILFNDEEAPFIFPITIDEEYLYYEDGNAMKDRVYMMDEDHQPGAQLWRMNLEDGSRHMIGEVGSRFMGIEDDRLYFVRESFGAMTEDGEMAEYAVEEGVYRMDLETLNTVCLWEPENIGDSYTRWRTLENGVLYGEYRDYSEGFASYIVRIDTDGNIIFELPVYNDHTDFICIANGIWYAIGTEDDLSDMLVCVDLETGEQKVFPFEKAESLYFAEGLPQIAVTHDRIYYYCYDEDMDAYCLKSMDFNGGDKALYAWENAF